MTKSQTFYYVAAVALIILFAYLYTSIVEAPHDTDTSTEATSTEETSAAPDVEETETAPSVDTEPVTETEPGITPSLPALEIETELAVATHELYGSSWQWQYSEDSDGTRTTPKKTGAFVLSFIDAGRMSSKTDCNSLGGEYKVSGDDLIFGEMMMTKMFCENSDEGVYGEQLRSVQTYDINGNTLSLSLTGGGTMTFTLVN